MEEKKIQSKEEKLENTIAKDISFCNNIYDHKPCEINTIWNQKIEELNHDLNEKAKKLQNKHDKELYSLKNLKIKHNRELNNLKNQFLHLGQLKEEKKIELEDKVHNYDFNDDLNEFNAEKLVKNIIKEIINSDQEEKLNEKMEQNEKKCEQICHDRNYSQSMINDVDQEKIIHEEPQKDQIIYKKEQNQLQDLDNSEAMKPPDFKKYVVDHSSLPNNITYFVDSRER